MICFEQIRSVVGLLRKMEFVALFFIMLVLGTFWNHLETFLYLYLGQLGAPHSLQGLTVTIGILPSIPFLFASDRIVSYCGHHHLLMLAFVTYCIRFIGKCTLWNMHYFRFLLKEISDVPIPY